MPVCLPIYLPHSCLPNCLTESVTCVVDCSWSGVEEIVAAVKAACQTVTFGSSAVAAAEAVSAQIDWQT